jgi:hypothetical protein
VIGRGASGPTEIGCVCLVAGSRDRDCDRIDLEDQLKGGIYRVARVQGRL